MAYGDTIHATHTSLFISRHIYDSFIVRKFIYHNLSNQFDISLQIRRFISNDGIGDSSIVSAVLINKKFHTIFDSVLVKSTLYFCNYFEKDDNVRSYSSGINVQKPIIDNYFGDIIIADLNFDRKDDIAIISDMGGNSGPLYKFFLQNNEHKFVLDRYLTDSMEFFPTIINKGEKTLTTYGHAGVMWVGRHIYKLDIETNTWKLLNL